jgi:hypothetical protein
VAAVSVVRRVLLRVCDRRDRKLSVSLYLSCAASTKYAAKSNKYRLWFGSFAKQRKKIIPLATGNVLEIGIGTGLNLPLDNKKIRLTAIDPSEDTWKKCTIDTKS